VVFQVAASDVDLNENSKIVFSFRSDAASSLFDINSTTGVITVNGDIDRETDTHLNLVVFATDQGSTPGPHTVSAALNITVLDLNDNSPVFAVGTKKNLFVSENASVGKLVGAFLAIDVDFKLNGTVSYELHSASSPRLFRLITVSGGANIVVNSSLDRETVSHVTAQLTASDAGEPPQSATLDLSIEIIDENDNRPKFLDPAYKFSTAENVPLGSEVGVVQATDIDDTMHNKFVYSIASGNTNDNFGINASSGAIIATKNLDREEISTYTLSVLATDLLRADLFSAVEVVIDIDDLNDNPPTYPYDARSFNVDESVPVGDIVFNLRAVDPDFTINGTLRYTVTDDGHGVFDVNASNGDVYVASAMDYESNVTVYQFVVHATEVSSEGRSATVDVTVNVNDVNDNAPKFIQTPYIMQTVYNIRISTKHLVGSEVTTVTATDKDSTKNAKITFDIIGGNNGGLFEIVTAGSGGTWTGQIKTTKVVDRFFQDEYALIVSATDGGTPAKSPRQR
jgi:hypothetical protein